MKWLTPPRHKKAGRRTAELRVEGDADCVRGCPAVHISSERRAAASLLFFLRQESEPVVWNSEGDTSDELNGFGSGPRVVQ